MYSCLFTSLLPDPWYCIPVHILRACDEGVFVVLETNANCSGGRGSWDKLENSKRMTVPMCKYVTQHHVCDKHKKVMCVLDGEEPAEMNGVCFRNDTKLLQRPQSEFRSTGTSKD